MDDSTNSEALFSRFFRYLAEFNVLLCKSHGYAISYSAIQYHLSSYHKELSPAIRSKLSTYTISLFTNNPRFPIEKINEIPELPLYFGLKCELSSILSNSKCGFISRSERYIKKHAKQVYNWPNQRGKGRYSKKNSEEKEDFWSSNIPCQIFFPIGAIGGYFEVIPKAQNISLPGRERPSELKRLADLNFEKRLQEFNSQNSIIEASQNRLEPNAWLDRTLWANHLSGYSWAEIRTFLTISDNSSDNSENSSDFLLSEPELLLESLTELVHRASNTAKPTIVGRNALEYVLRKETGLESNEKAGKFDLLPDSLRRYINIWRNLVIYLYNTFDLAIQDRPPYEPNEEQLIFWAKTRKTLRKIRSSNFRYVFDFLNLYLYFSAFFHSYFYYVLNFEF